MGRTTVTNAQFRQFIEATDYVTEAKRFGWSFVFEPGTAPRGATQGVVEVEWWRRVDGATWCSPNGPQTEDACLDDHPVVHISWNDARAYAAWSEAACRQKRNGNMQREEGRGCAYPWGEKEPNDNDYTPCNIWQGLLPETNTGADGHITTAPASRSSLMAMGCTTWSGMSGNGQQTPTR